MPSNAGSIIDKLYLSFLIYKLELVLISLCRVDGRINMLCQQVSAAPGDECECLFIIS